MQNSQVVFRAFTKCPDAVSRYAGRRRSVQTGGLGKHCRRVGPNEGEGIFNVSFIFEIVALFDDLIGNYRPPAPRALNAPELETITYRIEPAYPWSSKLCNKSTFEEANVRTNFPPYHRVSFLFFPSFLFAKPAISIITVALSLVRPNWWRKTIVMRSAW